MLKTLNNNYPITPPTFSSKEYSFKGKLGSTNLQKDVFEFSNDTFPTEKSLESLKNFKPFLKDSILKNFQISDLKPIKIFELVQNEKKPATAFMTTVKYNIDNVENRTGLFVFSKEGKIIGDIEFLDANECQIIKDSDKIGNYLRLHHLNASYFNNYKGIGSALIQEAILKSKAMGLEGQLKVFSKNVVNESKGSPTQFYGNMGFIDLNAPNHPKENFEDLGDEISLYLLNDENKKKLLKN